MATWLIVIIIAYLFFALSAMGDKLFLDGKAKPVAYAFYVSIFGLFVILFIPFINFGFPGYIGLAWVALTALTRLSAIYIGYKAIEKFEVSRVIPAMGALQPILIFALTWLYWGPQQIYAMYILAFVLLLLGSIFISFEKKIQLNKDYIILVFLTALMASLDFIFAKFVYTNMGFWQGFVWVALFIFLFGLGFLFSKENRNDIFLKQVIADKRNQLLFLSTQITGGLGGILYNLAIALTPIAFLAIANSLRGIQYAFLFFIIVIISLFAPKFFKETLSLRIIIQKIIAILLVVIGLIILAN